MLPGYCPVAIMKRFVELTLHSQWLRGPWRRVGIFWYSPSSRKMVDLLVNLSEREKRKPLQRSHCNKAISMKLLQSEVVFSFFFFFLFYISGHRYNNCFFSLYRIYCPWPSHRPCMDEKNGTALNHIPKDKYYPS